MNAEKDVRLELPRVDDTEEFSRDGIAFGFYNEMVKFCEPKEDTLGRHNFLNQKLQEAHEILDSSYDNSSYDPTEKQLEVKSRLLGMGFKLGFFDTTEFVRVIEYYCVAVMSREKVYPPVINISEERDGRWRYILLAFNHLPPPESWEL